jgi:hypothetical protein
MLETNLDQQVQDLHDSGYSIREIGSTLNLDKSKVHRILKKSRVFSPYSQPITSSAGNETFHQQLSGSSETLVLFSGDTADDTQDDTGKTGGDTPFDTGNLAKKDGFRTKNSPISPHNRYNDHEVKQLLIEIALFRQDYGEFVSGMYALHAGLAYVTSKNYHDYARKSLQLIQTAKLLAQRLDEEYNDLLVVQVLQSIYQTINKVLTGEDPVKENYGCYHLTDKRRAFRFWEESLVVDFITIKNEQ